MNAERLWKADRNLGVANVLCYVIGVWVFLARRKIRASISGAEQLEQANESLAGQVAQLRTQLDGALEALHEAGGSKDQAMDIPGSEPAGSTDTQGAAEAEQA